MTGRARETVVLVHGLYFTRHAMWPLGRRLRRLGYRTVDFGYPTLRRNLLQNAGALHRQVSRVDRAPVHYLAHSLGGLLLRHLFVAYPGLPPGRVVTLGTPHMGSAVARRLVARRLGWLCGGAVQDGLLGGLPPWPEDRPLGSIAGTMHVGLGRILGRLPGPADGTVAVAETRLPGMSDHLCLRVSHTGLLLSDAVAWQAHAFFGHARFDRRRGGTGPERVLDSEDKFES